MLFLHSHNNTEPFPRTLEMPGSEETVRLSDGETRYFRMGTGPPLILLHGLGSSSLVWFGNIAPLAKSHTVYAVDLPGHGRTYKSVWPRPLDQAVTFMMEFMDASGISNAPIVGNSMGGLLALATALQHPDRVQRVVLEGSAGLGSDAAWFLRLMTLPLLGEALAQPSRAAIRALLNRIFYNPVFATPTLVETIYRNRRLPGNKRSMLSILRSGVSIKGVNPNVIFTDQLSRINIPVLLLWGRNDLIFPLSHAERAVRLFPNAKLSVFDNCGHWPHVEFCKEFNGLVLDFCSLD